MVRKASLRKISKKNPSRERAERGRAWEEGKDEPKNGRTRDRRANRDEEGGAGGMGFKPSVPNVLTDVIFF